MDQINKFAEFCGRVETKYNKRKNPFHNYFHAVSVMNCCAQFCEFERVKQILNTDLMRFALIFSGYCHDISHTGNTNAFETNAMTKLTIRYNDRSVLENYSIAVTFKILQVESANFMIGFQDKDVREIRKLMIINILATDMKFHFDKLDKWEKIMVKYGHNQIADFGKDGQEKEQLSEMLIHAADFSGNTQEFEISRKWCNMINTEFMNQFTKEQKNNLPLTNFYKDLDKLEVLSKGEFNFAKIIVKPLWEQVNYVLKEEAIDQLLKNLDNNMKSWKQILDDEVQKKEVEKQKQDDQKSQKN